MSSTTGRLKDIPNAHIMETWTAVMGDFAKAMTGYSLWKGVDPLVLDLDGDGIEVDSPMKSGPRFEMDGDGFAERTGWVAGGDAFLALDRNGNGRIDDISELFGGPRRSGPVDLDGDGILSTAERYSSGFGDLAALDTNQDGVIDAADGAFADLKVWRDDNQNGVTDPDELLSLADAGIASISLTSTSTHTVIGQNVVTATGSFTRTNGTTGTIADVSLGLDNFDSVYLGDKTVSAEAAALPDLKGHGTLADLRVAMTQSETLRTLVAGLVAGGMTGSSISDLRAAARPVLLAWAAAIYPWNSRGCPVLVVTKY